MATLTNVGLFGNGRAFEYLLSRLYAAPLDELQALAAGMQEALDSLIPSFVKRAKSERGRAHQAYLRGMRERVAGAIADWESDTGDWELASQSAIADRRFQNGKPIASDSQSPTPVTLVEYDPDAEVKTVAAILYPHTDLPLERARELAARLAPRERLAIIRAYVGQRGSRFHRPGRAFEEPSYTFDLLADLGAYRDLQRHRILTQERQRYTVRHGYEMPPELEQAGLGAAYAQALERAAAAVDAIGADLPEQAQYAVPMAFRVRWRVKLNLRAAYHLAELRSAPQGHPSYRRIAQAIYEQIRTVHPTLAEGMRFVDMDDYELERLDAERRLDLKLSRAANADEPR
jgi:thymidylate synthase ThyX